MSSEKALHIYKNEKLNCAQSILKAFKEKFEISDEIISEAKKYGGGKAEDGKCGALHSALSLADKKAKQEFLQKFIELAGSDKCKEIRTAKKFSCADCVKFAADLLEEFSKKN